MEHEGALEGEIGIGSGGEGWRYAAVEGRSRG